MSKFSKNKNKNKQNKQRRRNQARNRRPAPRRTRQPPQQSGFSKMLTMIRDPCDAPLVNGVHGDISGLLARFHKNYTVKGTAAATPTAGYLLWVPDMTPNFNHVNGDTPGNLYLYLADSSASPATTLFNSTYTTYTPGTYRLTDPCMPFQSGELCSAVRHVSSCIKMRDIGKIVDVQGEITHLTNLPLEVLEKGANNGPSVDELFDFGEGIRRLDKGEISLKIPPSRFARFYDGEVGPYASNAFSRPSPEGTSGNATIHGIAWRGVDPTKVSLAIDVTKNIEWKPDKAAGMTQVHHTSEGRGSYVDRIVKALQDMDGPTWQQVINFGYGASNYYNHYNNLGVGRLR